jgi:CHRD domain
VRAAIIHFEVDLRGTSGNPPDNSAASGFAKVDIDTDIRVMFIDLTFSGLSGLTAAFHVHCCSAPTANAPVATQTPSFTGFLLGVTSGSFTTTST